MKELGSLYTFLAYILNRAHHVIPPAISLDTLDKRQKIKTYRFQA
jgi:hypothetical protein